MSIFNSIHPPRPADGLASRVARPGVHWTPQKKVLQDGAVHSDTPIPVQKFTGRKEHNLTGAVVGRLTVMGVSPMKATCGQTRWVVRCTCGSYGHRSAKYLKLERAKAEAMCRLCDHLEGLKAGQVPLADMRK